MRIRVTCTKHKFAQKCLLGISAYMVLGAGVSSAQINRVPVPIPKAKIAIAPVAVEPAPPAPAPAPPAPAPAPPAPAIPIIGGTADFKTVSVGSISLKAFNLPANNYIQSADIKDDGPTGTDPSPEYMYEYSNSGKYCDSEKNYCDALVIGFVPSDDHTAISATMVVKMIDRGTNKTSSVTMSLTGQGTKLACLLPRHKWMPLNWSIQLTSDNYPQPNPPAGIDQGLATRIYDDFGDPLKKLLVNCYYSTDSVSYFNQFQSIYNAASGSTTVNTNIASLNFTNGMQVTLAANPQISSSNTEASAGSASLTAGVPTLSAASAAQAAQNMLNGGTIFGSDILPLFSYQSNKMIRLNGMVNEGIDLQKFNNTSTTVSNPSTHTFVGLETYLQYNSSNYAPNSSDPAGSIFLGGKYGYSLTNHSYSVENGFGGRVNFQLAQLSAGILVNGVVKIAAYRGFGPSQQFIDSTTGIQRTNNNFQTWSFAIAYQSPSTKK